MPIDEPVNSEVDDQAKTANDDDDERDVGLDDALAGFQKAKDTVGKLIDQAKESLGEPGDE